jgi:stage II sporulation protein AA (anti-sigma F factor antagonist)
MSDPFEIQSVPGGDKVTILRLRGRLDARSGTQLLAHCAEVRNHGRHLVLNFAEVPFIASSGIGVLLVLVEEFRQTHRHLRIAPASPAVGSVIRLLNLQEFLAIHATEDEAVTELEAA